MKTYKGLKHKILTSLSLDAYVSMFDSMDSDEVIGLLRDLHRYQNAQSVNQLVAKLDSMLDILIEQEST